MGFSSRIRNSGLVLPAFAALLTCFSPHPAAAYPAAGDRIFVATVLLPQIAPSDDSYFTAGTLPFKSSPTTSDHANSFSLTYDKTLTERWGMGATFGYGTINQASGPGASGWQNFATFMEYLLVLDQEHEMELTAGVEHEWGGTGASKIGAASDGATVGSLYLAKGFGASDAPWLRPFALTAGLAY